MVWPVILLYYSSGVSMTTALVYSRAQCGMRAPLVSIEVHLSNGLPAFNIVGLPEKAVKESRDRVRSALLTNGYELPARRITVNLAPADLPKQGGRFDLPIALGLLAAQGVIDNHLLAEKEFAGELGLTGGLRAIAGALPFAIAAHAQGRELFLPQSNQYEASLVEGLTLYVANAFVDMVAHLCRVRPLRPCAVNHISKVTVGCDMSEVKGQAEAKYALEIAASGGHHVMMRGSPGSGKSMLAQRLPSILPPMSVEEAIESAVIRSIATRQFDIDNWLVRPFRAPHHSASVAALVGGGSCPQPGEISLAHHGVLFMDELPEFSRSVLESLREPLENRQVHISRAQQQVVFPADFMWVAAMNPCPCGYFLDKDIDCRCTPDQIQRYCARLSGPLLDRIDIRIDVARASIVSLMRAEQQEESSQVILQRVMAARAVQLARQGKLNSQLTGEDLQHACALSVTEFSYLNDVADKLKLSARGYYRTLRLARTIADKFAASRVERAHLNQALSWR
jgi:magnesium chelatase family protein